MAMPEKRLYQRRGSWGRQVYTLLRLYAYYALMCAVAGASAAHIAASGAVAKAKLPPLEASAHAASSGTTMHVLIFLV